MEKAGLKYLICAVFFLFQCQSKFQNRIQWRLLKVSGPAFLFLMEFDLKFKNEVLVVKKQKKWSKQKREKGFNTLDFLPFGANPKTKWRVIFF